MKNTLSEQAVQVAAAADHELAEHAKAIRDLGKRTVESIIEIGRRLARSKDLAGHGKWLPWLANEFGWDDRKAQRFIRIFEMSKSDKLTDLPFDLSGLYLLAAPSTPPSVRAELLNRARAGETVTHAKVARAVAGTKSPPRNRAAPSKPSEPAVTPVATSHQPAIVRSPRPNGFTRESAGAAWLEARRARERGIVNDLIAIVRRIAAADPATHVAGFQTEARDILSQGEKLGLIDREPEASSDSETVH